MNHHDIANWNAVVTADRVRLKEMLTSWNAIEDIERVNVMRRALDTPTERASALRLLLLLRNEGMKKAMFPVLVDLASVGHSDIDLCRLVIHTIPRAWVLQHVESEVDQVLNRAGDEEAFRRYAELYRELDAKLLESLVSRIRAHADPAFREIAEDFDGLEEG